MKYKESKPFPPELSLCVNCGGYFGKVKKKELDWDEYYFDKTQVEVSEEQLTISCVCSGRRCLSCGRYNQAPGSNVYYKSSNSVEHVPDFIVMRGCSYCGSKQFEESVLSVEKYQSLGKWYEWIKFDGYKISVIMCAGIDRAVEKWGLSVPEVFHLFLACKIIILVDKTFYYNIQGYKAAKKFYPHHCYDCDIYWINLWEHSNCPECSEECSSMIYNNRNKEEETCGKCFKKLAVREGFLIGFWLRGYFRCRNCAIKEYPHLKIYFKVAP